MRMDETTRALVRAEAAKAWPTFTKNEQSLVRFGMFPAERIEALEAIIGKDTPGLCREVAVALMDCAKADGGMRA